MSSDLHILIVSPDAPPHIGGMGRHVGSLAEGLRAAGVNVDIFDRSKRSLAWRIAKHLGFSFRLWPRLRSYVMSRTIVHAHAGPGGVFLVPPVGVRFLVTANHTYAQQSRLPGEGWKRIFIPWEKRMYERADHIVCISADTAQSLEDSYGIEKEKISVIECGFDLSSWIAADSEHRDRSCVFIGRPDSRKGWDLLTRAWAGFADATLHVVGWKETDRLGIVFHGRLSDSELATLVGRSRMVLCPSRMEGFGLAAAESIAAGTPVVATNVDGLQRVVTHERTGLLVSPDAASLAESIKKLFTDDALWNQLHAGCQKERDRFSLAREIDAYKRVYDALY